MKNHRARKCLHMLALAWLSVSLCAGAARAESDGAAPPHEDGIVQEQPAGEADIETAPSLDLVTRYAAEHNPAIRAARFTWKAARERITQKRAYANPMVTYSLDTGNTAETRAGPQGDGVGFSQAIPFPG